MRQKIGTNHKRGIFRGALLSYHKKKSFSRTYAVSPDKGQIASFLRISRFFQFVLHGGTVLVINIPVRGKGICFLLTFGIDLQLIQMGRNVAVNTVNNDQIPLLKPTKQAPILGPFKVLSGLFIHEIILRGGI